MPLRDMDREQMWLLPLIRTTDLCSGFVFRDLSLAVRGTRSPVVLASNLPWQPCQWRRGKLIKTHIRQPRGGRATDHDDYPAALTA